MPDEKGRARGSGGREGSGVDETLPDGAEREESALARVAQAVQERGRQLVGRRRTDASALRVAAFPEDRYCLTPELMLAGHHVEVLFDGGAAYPAMLGAIAAAKHTVDLEIYIWASDRAGRRFVDALCARARDGVRVRALYDGAGSFGFSSQDHQRLIDAGVKVEVFHPVAPWRARWGWQIRDHRKLLVCDSRVAFTGGMNLADDYAPADDDWRGGGWHDIHARVEGPAASDLQGLFDATWRYVTGETSEPRSPMRSRPGIPAGTGTALAAIDPASPTRVLALAVGRRRDRHAIQRHFHHAISAARERVWIESAYFIPNRTWRRVLRRAARRGVDVRIILPRYTDVPGVRYASTYTYASLLKDGVRLHEWLPSMLHAKVISVDGIWCTIGSYNLDQRSLMYNWEVALSIVDRLTCAAIDRRFEEDLASCQEVNEATWKDRGFWHRVNERIFYFFRMWL